ncbi:acylamino-acid-releasing enzyme [Aeropyrum pernix K1]|uniref:Acylamino-acid-releasing enzyme n=1 Tax=Aeropyrum pernix (strain ATCC 700893 / DSM 11879 / JCM 9820 / NBRC 100138 / K1) TaxID=272557 RepID=Q9YAW3_AERPE|nr:S9 family peptidase [Aeropyrum pernix]BAA80835.1 acylamino-acid-releasing enzyme [Aeropyrum pernix K1]
MPGPKKPVTPEDIIRLTFVSNPSVSPEGDKVAYLATKADEKENTYRSGIWLAEEDSYRPLTGGPYDRCPAWSPDGEIIAFSRTVNSNQRKRHYIAIVSPKGGEPQVLHESVSPATSIKWSSQGSMIGYLSRKPTGREWKPYSERDVLEIDRIPVWFDSEGWVFDRYWGLTVISYPGGEVLLEKGGVNYNIVDFDFAPDDNTIVYAVSTDMKKPFIHKLVLWDLASGREKTLIEGLTIAAVAFDPRGRYIAVKANDRKRGLFSHYKIFVYDLNSEEFVCLTCDLDLNTLNTVNSDARGPSCLRGMYWDDNGHLYYGVHNAGRMVVMKSRPLGEAEAVLDPSSATVDDFSISRGGDTIAYVKMGPTSPPDIYIYRDDNEYRLTDHNAWFAESRSLAEPVRLQVQSPLGGSIDAWILLPPDAGECSGCLPWILYIHGGPKTSYGYAFIHEFQMLASQGFAVIYSNPRGSDGYSEEFADLRGRYGVDDYSELMKVVDEALSDFPQLDPQRGGVTGGSYGGYMTNVIVTKTRRFKAAVTQRSCSNWISFYGESDIGWYFAPELISAQEPWRDLEKYVDFSPLFSVENIETPLLIIHSTEDFRCPLSGAIQLFTALKLKGVETRLLVFPGENHNLSRSGTPKRRVARLRAIASWFKEHLGSQQRG